MPKTHLVTGLRGTVKYFPSGPFAFGDPVCSLKARIRIDEAAETTRIDGKHVLYQRYHLYDAAQIPDARTRTDTERTKHYVDELQELIREYPEHISQLTSLEPAASSTVVHGEIETAYTGQHEMEVVRLPPRTRWRVKQRLESGE